MTCTHCDMQRKGDVGYSRIIAYREAKRMAKQTFEGAMERLEQIVGELEAGDLSLERAIKKFEEGVRLSKFCSRKLDETEKKVEILLRDEDGEPAAKPFQTQLDTEP